jgi:sugar lactone lactonase YvrE
MHPIHRAHEPPGCRGALVRSRPVTHATRVLTDGWTFLEGPRWHDGRFWVSDFYTRSLLAVSPDGEVETLAEVPGQSSGLGWLPDGDAVVVSMRDQRLLRLRDGVLSDHADLSGVLTGLVNDMVVDRTGRAYVGSFGFDLFAGEAMAPSAVAIVEPDGAVRLGAGDLLFPNGPVITPDGSTLVVAESFGQRLTAFTIAGDGSLTDRRTWADLSGAGVVPDGTTLDAEGCIWVADAGASQRAVRVREGGEIVDEVSGEGANVYACALGGPEGTTLVLCTAPSSDPAEAEAAKGARLVACTVDVPHAGLP